MAYFVIGLLIVGVFYLSVHLYLLKVSMKDAGKQLWEINEKLEENRLVRLSAPNKELEELLVEINNSLQGIRQERIVYAKREKEFKQQIENISHDLRTPLTSMIGYLKIMDASNLNEAEKEDLQTVLKKTERLQELISQFYDFSRLTAQDYPLELSAVDATKILREVMADAYSELSARNLEVTVDLPEGAVWIEGNVNALQRVFQNLLQNAGRYAVKELAVSVCEEAERVVICFKNDTKDLYEQEVERLFERFYTVDKSRSNGSTGLGLTIAKEFVEKMGGSMEAELEDGRWLVIRMSCGKEYGRKNIAEKILM